MYRSRTPSVRHRPPLARCSAASTATERRRGRRVLDHAAAGPERNRAGRSSSSASQSSITVSSSVQAGDGGPQHALHAEPAQTAGRPAPTGPDVLAGKYAKKTGAASASAPAGSPGQGRPAPPRTAPRRRARAPAGRGDLARLHLRTDRKRLDPLPVVGDPVDDLPAMFTELLGSHVRPPAHHANATNHTPGSRAGRPRPGDRTARPRRPTELGSSMPAGRPAPPKGDGRNVGVRGLGPPASMRPAPPAGAAGPPGTPRRAGSGTRTRKPFRADAFEAPVYADSTIPARRAPEV